jgi:hypothetical protein
MVLEGSFALFNEFFDEHEDQQPEGGWPTEDFYPHTIEQIQWFYDRGCQWKKVCASPGDLILWDSRCIHYGSIPKGRNPRIATCTFLVREPTKGLCSRHRCLLQACG